MDDRGILQLFFLRNENAIKESKTKYGRLCRSLALHILGSREDAEETENDTYLRAWNTIPPTEPDSLGAYLAAVCRRLSIDRLRSRYRQKRGGGVYTESLDELEHTVSAFDADPADLTALKDALEHFLDSLPPEQRRIFLQRYWWARSIREIARDCGKSESAVKMTLARTREKLRDYLKGEFQI